MIQTISNATFFDEADILQALSLNSFTHKQVQVAPSATISGQRGLIAQTDLPKGTIVFVHRSEVSYTRTRTSIQIDNEVHIEADGFGVFTNHSCNPNAVICSIRDGMYATVCLITICLIKRGDEITFDYATTETELTAELQNASCLCKAPNCRQIMKGNKNLYQD